MAHIFKELSVNFPNCINTVFTARRGLILHNMSYQKKLYAKSMPVEALYMPKERETYLLRATDITHRPLSKTDVTACSRVFVTDNFEAVVRTTNI